MTIGVFLLSAFIARYSPAGVLLMASVFALWPLGFVLSLMGLTRPGARVLAGIGLAVSVGGAWIVLLAVVKVLKGGV